MNGIRPYAVSAAIIAGQGLISLYFVLAGRLPDPAAVPEWPSGVSTGMVPLWIAAVFAPAFSCFMLGALALDARIGRRVSLKRVEPWRLRGVPGPLTEATLLALLVLHWLALENVASRWSLDQGVLASVCGATLGALMLAIGNYQTKVASVGLWALTPWRVEEISVRQRCQRIASRVAIGGGAAMIAVNVALAGSRPVGFLGAAPVHAQLLVTLAMGLGIYAVVAWLTWWTIRDGDRAPG